jgi:hypothetical protein
VKQLTRILGLLMLIAALTALGACNQRTAAVPSHSAAAPAGIATPSAAPMTPRQPAAAGSTSLASHAAAKPASASPASPSQAGGTLQLASGERVPIIGVLQLNTDAKAHVGLVALEARVMLTDPQRSTVVLVDLAKGARCTTGCNPAATFPMHVVLENYQGGLPAANTQVLVIGRVSLAGDDFKLDVREVRQGDKVILKELAQAHQP